MERSKKKHTKRNKHNQYTSDTMTMMTHTMIDESHTPSEWKNSKRYFCWKYPFNGKNFKLDYYLKWNHYEVDTTTHTTIFLSRSLSLSAFRCLSFYISRPGGHSTPHYTTPQHERRRRRRQTLVLCTFTGEVKSWVGQVSVVWLFRSFVSRPLSPSNVDVYLFCLFTVCMHNKDNDGNMVMRMMMTTITICVDADNNDDDDDDAHSTPWMVHYSDHSHVHLCCRSKFISSLVRSVVRSLATTHCVYARASMWGNVMVLIWKSSKQVRMVMLQWFEWCFAVISGIHLPSTSTSTYSPFSVGRSVMHYAFARTFSSICCDGLSVGRSIKWSSQWQTNFIRFCLETSFSISNLKRWMAQNCQIWLESFGIPSV